MNRVGKVFRSANLPLRVLAVAALFLFLALLAFAALPELHQIFHADAKDAHHHCAITLLTHGQVDAPACDVSTTVPNACVELCSFLTISVPGTTFEQIGRASCRERV